MSRDKRSQFNSTQNYIWSMDDVLGKGAYGAVYKCRNKETGKLAAVKVSRTDTESDRNERQIMRQLNHENIVKVLSIEKMVSGNAYRGFEEVMVMEFCSGKSLYHFLEEPINVYGMDDKFFLIFLRDIVAALEYLHQYGKENGSRIVHRDIKPLNILMTFKDDGQLIFKLSDFGTAKFVDPDEETVGTLVGTPEYLQPNMFFHYTHQPHYLRGVFDANAADLWPLGTSIYYAACGSLPFRPFGSLTDSGVRKEMCNMINNKPLGAISAVQKSPTSFPEYSETLPETCRLSKHLQSLIVPLLAKFLMSKPDASFNWFAAVRNIVDRKLVHYFIPHFGVLAHVYVEGDISRDSVWKEVLKMHGSLEITEFEMWWKGFPVADDKPLPKSDEFYKDEPVMIISKDLNWPDFTFKYPYDIPNTFWKEQRPDPGEDKKVARLVTGKLLQTLAESKHLRNVQMQYNKYLRYMYGFFKFRVDAFYKPTMDIAEITTHVAGMLETLKGIRQALPANASLRTMDDPFLSVEAMCLKANNIMREGENLTSIFNLNSLNIEDQICSLECEGTIENMAKSAAAILSDFKKDLDIAKEARAWDISSGAYRDFAVIHNLDKKMLKDMDKKSTAHIKNYCASKTTSLHREISSWASEIHTGLKKIDDLEREYNELTRLKKTLQEWTHQYGEQLRKYIECRLVRVPRNTATEDEKNEIFARATLALEQSQRILENYQKKPGEV